MINMIIYMYTSSCMNQKFMNNYSQIYSFINGSLDSFEKWIKRNGWDEKKLSIKGVLGHFYI